MDRAIEELKQQLRAKHFALDDIVPMSERAARTIERLQAEIGVLMRELESYHAGDLGNHQKARLSALPESLPEEFKKQEICEADKLLLEVEAALQWIVENSKKDRKLAVNLKKKIRHYLLAKDL